MFYASVVQLCVECQRLCVFSACTNNVPIVITGEWGAPTTNLYVRVK